MQKKALFVYIWSLIPCRFREIFDLAEGVGFEPTDTFVSPVFKTGAFGRSATPPVIIYFLLIKNNISLSYWSRKIL